MREQMVGDGLVVREHVPIWPWKPCLLPEDLQESEP